MLQRRLTLEVWRHGICVMAMFLIMGAAMVLGAAESTTRGHLVWQTGASFLAMGVYGMLYVALTWLGYRGLRGEELRAHLRRARAGTPSWARRGLLLGPRMWAFTVAAMALTGVLTMMVLGRAAAPMLLSLTGIVCVLGAWVLLLGVFADEYGRAWAERDAFGFADDDAARSFGDFFYLAIQISTTFSGSDVTVRDGRARAAVSAHALTAWAFSTVIIALLVSLALPA